MDKVKLEFKVPKIRIAEYNGKEIEVIPELLISQQALLINKYVQTYFGTVETPLIDGQGYNFLEAEYDMIGYIIQMNTNIDMTNFPNDLYVDDTFIKLILGEITNYESFRKSLDKIVADIKESKNSEYALGKVLSEFFDNISATVEKFTNINTDELKEIIKDSEKLLKRTEDSSLVQNSKAGLGMDTPALKPKRRSSKPKAI